MRCLFILMRRCYMPIYMKLIETSRIIEMIKMFSGILILACKGCPNESLAYSNGSLLTENEVPYTLNQEIERLSKILTKQGFNIETQIITESYLCLMSDEHCESLKYKMPNSDAVLVLGCPAAVQGTKSIIGDSRRVILGMESIGPFYYAYASQPISGNQHIVEAKFVKI